MTDYKKYCPTCQGAGQVDTGIDESPVTVCNQCNGTGLKAQRTWVGLTDIDYAGLPLEQVGLVRWAEAKLKEMNG